MAKIVKHANSTEERKTAAPTASTRQGSFNGRTVTASPISNSSSAPRPAPLSVPANPSPTITNIRRVPVESQSTGSRTSQPKALPPTPPPKPSPKPVAKQVSQEDLREAENQRSSTNQASHTRNATQPVKPIARSQTLKPQSSPSVKAPASSPTGAFPPRQNESNRAHSNTPEGGNISQPSAPFTIPRPPQHKMVHRSNSDYTAPHSSSSDTSDGPDIELQSAAMDKIPPAADPLRTFSPKERPLTRSDSVASSVASDTSSQAFTLVPKYPSKAPVKEPETPSASGQTTPVRGTPSSSPLSKINPDETPNPLRKGLEINEQAMIWARVRQHIDHACTAFRANCKSFTMRVEGIVWQRYQEILSGEAPDAPVISKSLEEYINSKHTEKEKYAACMLFLFSTGKFSSIKHLLYTTSSLYEFAVSYIEETNAYKRISPQIPEQSKPKTPRASEPSSENPQTASDQGIINPNSGSQDTAAPLNIQEEAMLDWAKETARARKEDSSDEESEAEAARESNNRRRELFPDQNENATNEGDEIPVVFSPLLLRKGQDAWEKFQHKLLNQQRGHHNYTQSLTRPLSFDPTAKLSDSSPPQQTFSASVPSSPKTKRPTLSPRKTAEEGQAEPDNRQRVPQTEEPDLMLPLGRSETYTSAPDLSRESAQTRSPRGQANKARRSGLRSNHGSVHNSPNATPKKGDSLYSAGNSPVEASSPVANEKHKQAKSAPSTPSGSRKGLKDTLRVKWFFSSKKTAVAPVEHTKSGNERESPQAPPIFPIEPSTPHTPVLAEPLETIHSLGADEPSNASEDNASITSLPENKPLEKVIQSLSETQEQLRQEQQQPSPHSVQSSPGLLPIKGEKALNETLFGGLKDDGQSTHNSPTDSSRVDALQSVLNEFSKSRQAQQASPRSIESSPNDRADSSRIKEPKEKPTQSEPPSPVSSNLEPAQPPSEPGGRPSSVEPDFFSSLRQPALQTSAPDLFDPTRLQSIRIARGNLSPLTKSNPNDLTSPEKRSLKLFGDRDYQNGDWNGSNLLPISPQPASRSEPRPTSNRGEKVSEHPLIEQPRDQLPAVIFKKDFSILIDCLISQGIDYWKFIFPMEIEELNIDKPASTLVDNWGQYYNLYSMLMNKLPEGYFVPIEDIGLQFLKLDMYLQAIHSSDKVAKSISKQLQENPAFNHWQEPLRKVSGFHELTQLMMNNSKLRESVKSLTISNSNLFFYPVFVSKQIFPALEVLKISGTKISEIPDLDFDCLSRVDFSYNKLIKIPSFRACHRLVEVVLTGNSIRSFDSSRFPEKLEKLYIGKNPPLKLKLHKDLFSGFKSLRTLDLSCLQIDFSEETVRKGWFSSSQIKYFSIDIPPLRELDISCSGLTQLPNLSGCLNLINLNADGNNLSELSLSNMPNSLKKLSLRGNRGIKLKFPLAWPGSAMLKFLDISNTRISGLPDLSEYESLEELDVSDNLIEEIDINKFPKKIKTLNLSGNKKLVRLIEVGGIKPFVDDKIIERFFSLYNKFECLERLNLSFIGFDRIPNLQGLFSLRELDLEGNLLETLDFKALPKKIKKISLTINKDKVPLLERRIGYFTELNTLKISDSGLTELPNFSDVTGDLKILDLSGNKIQVIDCSRLPWQRLEVLNLSANPLKRESPKESVCVLSQHFSRRAPKLLRVSKSALLEAPNLSDLSGVEYLDLSYNALKTVDLSKLPTQLKGLDLSGNPLEPRNIEPNVRWDGILELEGDFRRFKDIQIICTDTGVESFRAGGVSIPPVQTFSLYPEADEEKSN